MGSPWFTTGASLVYFFMDGLEEGSEYTLSNFADDNELGRNVDLLDGKKPLQRDCDGLNQQAEANCLKLNKMK